MNIPLGVFGWGPQIAYNREQCKCKNIPESCDNPSTLPPLVEGICCFKINLQEKITDAWGVAISYENYRKLSIKLADIFSDSNSKPASLSTCYKQETYAHVAKCKK